LLELKIEERFFLKERLNPKDCSAIKNQIKFSMYMELFPSERMDLFHKNFKDSIK